MAIRRPKGPTGTFNAPTIPAASTPAPIRSEVKGSGTAKPAAMPREVTREMIEKRAYEIYASRGFAPGNPDEDWHEAERQLRAGL